MEENALTLPLTEEALTQYAAAVKELYRRKLLERDKVTRLSGMLTGTIRAIVESNGHGYEVSLSLQDYWKYVEAGSRGTLTSPTGALGKAHWPPPSAIMEWIRVKPIAPRPDSRGRLPSEKSLAFLIGRKIYHHGIEPVPALASTLEELNAVWLPRIEAAFNDDLAAAIGKVFEVLEEPVLMPRG